MCGQLLINGWPEKLLSRAEMQRLIEDSLYAKDRSGRIRAVIRMGESGDPRAVSPLIDCCRDPDPDVRRHATGSLCRLRSGRAVAVLIERLTDRREELATRQRAAEALALIGTWSAIEGLRGRLADINEEEFIRTYVSEVMGKAKIL